MISYEQFVKSCRNFIELSKKLNDGWIAYNCPNEEYYDVDDPLYLKKKMIKSVGIKNKIDTGRDLMEDENLEVKDESALSYQEEKELITFEYNILYSIAHSVPVLYFNAWKSTGEQLKLEQIWENIHDHYKSSLLSHKWESLTQVEHPIYGRPYFQLHPCHTAELMKNFLDTQMEADWIQNYIQSWLSAFGSVVGLQVSCNYFKNNSLLS